MATPLGEAKKTTSHDNRLSVIGYKKSFFNFLLNE
jgi:hypothetical protein